MSLSVDQLEAFLAVAEERRFTRAARRLGTSQPGLSRQIQALERELDAKLVVRSPRGIVLTDAGARFLAHAQRSLDALRTGRAALDEISREPRGTVSLGALPTVGAYLLPDLIAKFRRKFPAVRLRLDEGLVEALEERVASGVLDLAIVEMPIRRVELVSQKLWDEDFVLGVPRGHRLARARRAIPLAEIVSEPLVTLAGTRGMQAIERAAENAGRPPQIVVEAPHVEMMRRMVERGVGLAFLPSIVARSEGRRFEIVRVGAGGIRRTVSLVHRGESYLPAAARALKNEITAALKRSRPGSSR